MADQRYLSPNQPVVGERSGFWGGLDRRVDSEQRDRMRKTIKSPAAARPQAPDGYTYFQLPNGRWTLADNKLSADDTKAFLANQYNLDVGRKAAEEAAKPGAHGLADDEFNRRIRSIAHPDSYQGKAETLAQIALTGGLGAVGGAAAKALSALPKALPWLGRTLGGAAYGGGKAALEGKDAVGIAGDAALGAGYNQIGEGLGGAVGMLPGGSWGSPAAAATPRGTLSSASKNPPPGRGGPVAGSSTGRQYQGGGGASTVPVPPDPGTGGRLATKPPSTPGAPLDVDPYRLRQLDEAMKGPGTGGRLATKPPAGPAGEIPGDGLPSPVGTGGRLATVPPAGPAADIPASPELQAQNLAEQIAQLRALVAKGEAGPAREIPGTGLPAQNVGTGGRLVPKEPAGPSGEIALSPEGAAQLRRPGARWDEKQVGPDAPVDMPGATPKAGAAKPAEPAAAEPGAAQAPDLETLLRESILDLEKSHPAHGTPHAPSGERIAREALSDTTHGKDSPGAYIRENEGEFGRRAKDWFAGLSGDQQGKIAQALLYRLLIGLGGGATGGYLGGGRGAMLGGSTLLAEGAYHAGKAGVRGAQALGEHQPPSGIQSLIDVLMNNTRDSAVTKHFLNQEDPNNPGQLLPR